MCCCSCYGERPGSRNHPCGPCWNQDWHRCFHPGGGHSLEPLDALPVAVSFVPHGSGQKWWKFIQYSHIQKEPLLGWFHIDHHWWNHGWAMAMVNDGYGDSADSQQQWSSRTTIIPNDSRYYSTQPSFESFMMTSWQCRMLQDGELFDFDREVEPILDVLVSCQPATEDHWDPSGKILYRTTSPLSYSLWPSNFLRWWRPWSSPSWNLPRESGRFSFFSPEYISLYHLSSIIYIYIYIYMCVYLLINQYIYI